jgi:hypothetical protein
MIDNREATLLTPSLDPNSWVRELLTQEILAIITSQSNVSNLAASQSFQRGQRMWVRSV